MAYVNPLHTPVRPGQHSPFSSLSTAVAHNAQFTSSRRRRVPQKSYTSVVSKWGSATGRVAALHNPIAFDYIGFSKQGVPMCELAGRSMTAISQMVVGANDMVLAAGMQRINFRIIWPGYEHVDWARSVEVATSGLMNRGQLGAAIAMNFARFIDVPRTEKASSGDWYVGPTGIRFDQLVLVGLYNVVDDVWQADVAVDFR
ncbi:hypothetical protein BDQ17DRAFT_1247341 [Cyathus striatus]|nr:hypothetical protein BDQ17DRAFT_1247341 [Cyathus striatus]